MSVTHFEKEESPDISLVSGLDNEDYLRVIDKADLSVSNYDDESISHQNFEISDQDRKLLQFFKVFERDFPSKLMVIFRNSITNSTITAMKQIFSTLEMVVKASFQEMVNSQQNPFLLILDFIQSTTGANLPGSVKKMYLKTNILPKLKFSLMGKARDVINEQVLSGRLFKRPVSVTIMAYLMEKVQKFYKSPIAYREVFKPQELPDQNNIFEEFYYEMKRIFEIAIVSSAFDVYHFNQVSTIIEETLNQMAKAQAYRDVGIIEEDEKGVYINIPKAKYFMKLRNPNEYSYSLKNVDNDFVKFVEDI